ncbi:efflux RND transporter periplasmic adaptor subunit [uncultured Odoribacter sp.]|uniref:efflux RND transporter periplasmic adaptor subunit n=1 Tax=uncultured Odoribacter sp. TaxID=876416 RepID=UPI00260E3A56|nr:efflux RND transporter periplasmic adaptor subunit [uncultured Odoribacter sp.]
MKKGIFLFLLLSILTGGCRKGQEKKEQAQATAVVPEILVNTPEEQDVTYTYEYPAYLEAEQTVNLVARVSGFLEKILYTPGQLVKTGQLLFVIEPKPYIDQVKAAESQVKSAEAQLAYAKASYERMKEAVQTKAISEIDYLQAQSTYNSAQASLDNARSQLNTARINLNYCYIKAPFDGRVSRNLVDQANYVAGSVEPTTLATMYKDKRMYAYFNMAYAEYENLPPVNANLPPNDPLRFLTVTDAADPHRQWKGELDYTSPNVDLQTGTVNVRAIIENPHEELLSGMYVNISVPYRNVKDALLIPETSIGTNQTGRFVYIVDRDNRIELKPVTVGVLESDGMRQIISGIRRDDRYVVEALMSVRPGMSVKPVTRK